MSEYVVTDKGLRCRVVRSPDDEGATVLDVSPGKRRQWPANGPRLMVGQSFGMNWHDRMYPMRVVEAKLMPNGLMRLVCR